MIAMEGPKLEAITESEVVLSVVRLQLHRTVP